MTADRKKKIALFAFNGDFRCFIHVLLNALDMQSRDYDVKLVIEGSATALVPEMAREGNPMHALYKRTKEAGLIDAVCKACAMQAKVLEFVQAEGLPIADDMSGHPSMARYMEEGYELITF